MSHAHAIPLSSIADRGFYEIISTCFIMFLSSLIGFIAGSSAEPVDILKLSARLVLGRAFNTASVFVPDCGQQPRFSTRRLSCTCPIADRKTTKLQLANSRKDASGDDRSKLRFCCSRLLYWSAADQGFLLRGRK